MSKIYLSNWFYAVFFSTVLLIGLSSLMEWLYLPAMIIFLSLIALTVVDAILVFSSKSPLHLQRKVNHRLNLSDQNRIELLVSNTCNQPIYFELHEGYPIEMQERNSIFKKWLPKGQSVTFTYHFSPKKRGDVQFLNAFFILSSLFRLVYRKYIIANEESVKVYPSIAQLKKYELQVFHQQKNHSGIKRMRRLGNNSEFEQIKPYIQGDEVKTINWKATSRSSNLMVNKYQEEKSQQIYCVIDKSRSMQQEFDQLSLLDYSINSTLSLSNILIKNGDKAGLITFSDGIGSHVVAKKDTQQLHAISEQLYNQKTQFLNPNYELLYQVIRRNLKTRSLILLYTNFETETALERALPTLININRKHVLVVILFQNTDLEQLAYQEIDTRRNLYQSIVAEQMLNLKSKISLRLKQNGIQTILTLPENLTVNSINKYLELKSKGVI